MDETPRLLGVDVSHWQGRLDWKALRGAGVVFGLAKATQGLVFADDLYGYNHQEMRAARVIEGAYHFLTGGGTGREQADHFLDVIETTRGKFLALDVENSWPDPTETDVRDFLTRFRERRPGRPIFIYTNEAYWRSIGNPQIADEKTLLWEARWSINKRLPIEDVDLEPLSFEVDFGGWDMATVRQFTSHGRFQDTRLDLDAYLGNRKSLALLTGTKGKDALD